MTMKTDYQDTICLESMEVNFRQHDNVGIFTFHGELTDLHTENLQLILIRAIHGIDRAVLNFKTVTRIDTSCLKLLRTAYCTSLRLKNPLILTEVPEHCLPDLFGC